MLLSCRTEPERSHDNKTHYFIFEMISFFVGYLDGWLVNWLAGRLA